MRDIDEQIVTTLETLLNLSVSPEGASQARLPIALGGLGLTSCVALALPSHVASLQKSSDMVKHILPDYAWQLFQESVASLTAKASDEIGTVTRPESSKEWMALLHNKSATALLASAGDDQNKARLLAVSRPQAGAWLHALPVEALGTWMDDESVRVCTALRLGSPTGEAHVCACGEPVGPSGRHGLSCKRSAGRLSRHEAINNTFARALRSAGIPCVLEPNGLSSADGKRPDGMSLIPFEKGRVLVWDATVTDSLTPSIVRAAAARPGLGVTRAEDIKTRKYSAIVTSHAFYPLAFETLGGPGPITKTLLEKVGKRLVEATGDERAHQFLQQRLSIDTQRGNAAAVMGTLARWTGPGLFERPTDGTG